MYEELARLVKEIKSQGYEDICFFQPVYAITGATTCKIQMAKYLAEHTDLKIHLCDFRYISVDFYKFLAIFLCQTRLFPSCIKRK